MELPTLAERFIQSATRGITYRYLIHTIPHTREQPTILFLHGFPSTSRDWLRILAVLLPKGYRLIAPDLLGFGGTDKPLDPAAYDILAITRDLCDILDAEGVRKVIVVGHDWGCFAASRFYNYAPERVTAAVFLAAPYIEPAPDFNVETFNKHTKEALGYEVYGYFFFFAREDAPEIIADHLDSFMSLFFPADPESWKTDLAPLDKYEQWLLANRTSPRPSYLSEEDYRTTRDTLARNGVRAAMNWYRSWVTGLNILNSKSIPEENYDVTVPVFYGAAKKDYVCREDMGKQATEKRCKHPDTVVREYDGDHWIIFSHAEAIAEDLAEWIEGLRAKGVL